MCIYKKDAALQSYWMPHVFSENPFKRKVSCLLMQMPPESQAVLCAQNNWGKILLLIYIICMVSFNSGTKIVIFLFSASKYRDFLSIKCFFKFYF